MTADLIPSRRDQMTGLGQLRAGLDNGVPYREIKAFLVDWFLCQVHASVRIEEKDLLGRSVSGAGTGAYSESRPRLTTLLMVALQYLKRTFNASNVEFVRRSGELPSGQHFTFNQYFEYRRPCDLTPLASFRKFLGEEGVEELLARSIGAAGILKLITKVELCSVIVDPTVQEKVITYPSDGKLLETAHVKLVEAAMVQGIELKQTYAKEGQLLVHKVGRYAHTRLRERMRCTIKRQSTIAGRLWRGISPKVNVFSVAGQDALNDSLHKARCLITQTHCRKTQRKQPMLHGWYAPGVECISKSKSRDRFEFGVKVGFASTLEGNLIVGAQAFPGYPYSGHTLDKQIEQANILMRSTCVLPQLAFVDHVYCGVDKDSPGLNIKQWGRFKSLGDKDKTLLKRRPATVPIIGDLKSDRQLNRCHLKGAQGDRLHVVSCSTSNNLRCMLRMSAQKGTTALLGPCMAAY